MAKKKNTDTMAVDHFEREYSQQIEWRTEQILGDGPHGSDYDEAYDAAYEQAIDEVAADYGITLL